jgi:hypothetical protein
LVVFFSHGQDNDRDPRPLAHLPGHFDAVQIRQSQVEDDQVGAITKHGSQGLLAGACFENGVAMSGECSAQKAPDHPLVVDHQHTHATLGH